MTGRSEWARVGVFLWALLLPAGIAWGASISGKVSDAEGSAVTGAQIIVQDTQSAFSTVVVSQPDSSYTLESLPPGVYTLTVRKPGYAELVREQVAAGNGSEPVQLHLQLRPTQEEATSRATEELNPNVFVVKLDTNEIVRQISTRGANPQPMAEFRSQENYYGGLYGYPLRKVEMAKPGTLLRKFHGSLYEAHQNSAVNARSFFTVGGLLPSRRNDYGATVGGPLVQDKLSFDAAWGQVRDSGYVNGNIQVPLPQERVPQSDDPASNAVIARLLDAYPKELPNLPHVSRRHLNTNALRDISSTAFSTRLNYRPGQADQLVLEQRFLDSAEQPFELVPGQNPVTLLRPQSYHLSHVHTFSPRVISRLSVNFDRLSVFLDTTERYKNLLAPLGIATAPEISFGRSGDFTSLGPGPDYPRRRVENRFHFAPEMTWVRGNHMLSAGALLSRLQTNDLQSDNSRGVFEFNNNRGLSAVQNFLLGRPTSFKINLGSFYRGFRNWENALYVHDAIRVRPDLTLSLGLRYEVVTAPVEVDHLTTISYRTDANNFAPQFGFAWNPGRGKTVVRGGYGITFSTIFPLLYQRARFNPPAVQVISVDEEAQLQALFKGAPVESGSAQRSGLNLLSPDLVSPYAHVYTLAIERELPASLSLRLGYLGSRGIKIPWEVVSNRARPVPGIPTTTATINQRRPDPRYLEITTVANGSISYFDALQVSVDKRLSGGLSWTARYTFSKAINTGDTTFADIGTGRHLAMDDNIVGDLKAVEQFDTPHALTLGYRYEFPGAQLRGIKSVLGGWTVSGATTFRSGTPYMLHTGSDAPGFGNTDGVGQDRPNLLNLSILGKSVDHPDRSQSILRREYFDTNIPAGGRGNLGFNTFRGDGTDNWNVAVEKEFSFRESNRQSPTLQFRAEFLNFLNHAQFDWYAPHVANEIFGKITNTANRGRVMQFFLRLRL